MLACILISVFNSYGIVIKVIHRKFNMPTTTSIFWLYMNGYEEFVTYWYETHWEPGFRRWWKGNETLALHAGLYENGKESFEEALINMNKFVGRLLRLKKDSRMNILDAGCGVGGTSIYLGNKYPNATFTGITISKKQVELAERFASERNRNSNINFLLMNYMNTSFPDNYFDGAFALESVSYAPSKKKFLKEMYRIIKPEGKLVVIAPFILKKDMNWFMKNVHHLYDLGRGNPFTFPVIEDFKSYLTEINFKSYRFIDLSKNITRSQIRSSLLAIPFCLSVVLKKLLFGKRYNPLKDPDYYIAVSILAVMMGLSHTAGYFAVVAEK